MGAPLSSHYSPFASFALYRRSSHDARIAHAFSGATAFGSACIERLQVICRQRDRQAKLRERHVVHQRLISPTPFPTGYVRHPKPRDDLTPSRISAFIASNGAQHLPTLGHHARDEPLKLIDSCLKSRDLCPEQLTLVSQRG